MACGHSKIAVLVFILATLLAKVIEGGKNPYVWLAVETQEESSTTIHDSLLRPCDWNRS